MGSERGGQEQSTRAEGRGGGGEEGKRKEEEKVEAEVLEGPQG